MGKSKDERDLNVIARMKYHKEQKREANKQHNDASGGKHE